LPLSGWFGSPRDEWVFVQKCLLERKCSYLTEKGLFSCKAELAREKNGTGEHRSTSHSATQLIDAIAQTFALKGLDEVTPAPAVRQREGDDRDVREDPDELGLAAHAHFSQDGAQLGP
jgi:hypothetical protein